MKEVSLPPPHYLFSSSLGPKCSPYCVQYVYPSRAPFSLSAEAAIRWNMSERAGGGVVILIVEETPAGKTYRRT